MRRESRRPFPKLFYLLVLAAAGLLSLALFRVGPPPSVNLEPELPGIGKRTGVRVTVEEPRRGLSSVLVELVQGEQRAVLAEARYAPLPFWAFWGARTRHAEFSVEVGRDLQPWLAEGEAIVRVVAGRAGTPLRRPRPREEARALPVRLRPPSLQLTAAPERVAQGGSGLVRYRVGETTVRDGVRAGSWWFAGYALPGGDPRERFCLFGVPFDVEGPGQLWLVAEDAVRNEASLALPAQVARSPVRHDTIRLSEAFMGKVVPEISAMTPELEPGGDLLESYLRINGDLRRRNSEALRELARRSAEAFLWREAFLQMPNSKVMSGFADHRVYLFDGRRVDEQDHLGFDLASTRQAPVPAANDGTVLLARYFGIYGNTVVLDHGYGLMSLYGHLSSIAVTEGQRVGRGETLGHTGETGLAGGDHLHFTMLVQGLPVNPLEWWDPRWIRADLKTKLGAALPFE